MQLMPDPGIPGLFRAETGAFATACAMNEDGSNAAFAMGDGRLLLCDTTSKELTAVLPHQGAALCLAPIGPAFLSGGDDGRVVLTLATGQGRDLFQRKGKWIEHLAVGSEGRFAAAMGRDILYFEPGQTEDGQLPAPVTLGPLPGAAGGLVATDRGRMLAACHNGGLTLFDVPPSSSAGQRLEADGGHLALAASPDGRFVAAATPDKAVRVFDLENQEGYMLEGYPTRVECLAFDHSGRYLMTGGEQAVVLWDLMAPPEERGNAIAFGAFEHGYLRVVAPHPALPLLAAGFDGGVVFLGDSTRRTAQALFAMPGSKVTCLTWAPDGRFLIGGSDAGAVFLLDLIALAKA